MKGTVPAGNEASPDAPRLTIWLTSVGFALLCVSRVFGTAPTGDEPFYAEMRETLFANPIDWDTQQLLHHAPLGPFFQGAVRALLEFVPEAASLYPVRLGMLAFSALLGIYVFRFTRALYGVTCAAAALFLILWNPIFAGHASTANLDVAVTALSFAALYHWWRGGHDGARHAVITGVFLGLALLTKHVALLTAAVIGADAILGAAAKALRRRGAPEVRGVSVRLAIAALVALFVLNAGYGFGGTGRSLSSYAALSGPVIAASHTPALSDLPLPLPSLFVRSVDYQLYLSGLGHPGFFRGEYSLDGWQSYQAVGFLLKNPIPLFFMLAFAIWHWVRRGATTREGSDTSAGERLLAWSAAAFAIYFTFFNTRAQGIRYLLPGFPPLFVLLSGALASVDLKVRLQRGAVAVLGVFYAAAVLISHPNEIAYLNALSGGTRAGYRTFLSDSNLDWGQSGWLVDRALADMPPPVAVNPERPTTGRVLVQAAVYRDYLDPTARRAWLRGLRPERVLYGTHLLFDVKEEELRARHEEEPGDVARVLALASIRLDRGDAAGALEILGRVSSPSEAAPSLFVLRGLALAQFERWPEAFRAWEQAVNRFPDSAPAWSQLAFASAVEGRPDAAALDARAATAAAKMAHAVHQPIWRAKDRAELAGQSHPGRKLLENQEWVISNNRGFEAWSNGAYDDAIARFRETVAAQPRFAHGYVNLARALEARGDLPGAIEAQREAVSLLPSARALRQPRVFFGDRVLLLGHALRCSARGESDEVAYLDLLVARSVWEARPYSAERDSKLARIHLASGRPAVAMVYLRRAYEREPGRDRALITGLLSRFRIEPASVDWFER